MPLNYMSFVWELDFFIVEHVNSYVIYLIYQLFIVKIKGTIIYIFH